MDKVPSELLKSGGEATTTVLTAICQKIWEMKEWLKDWTQLLIIPLPKKGNLKQCQNYHTISLISHPNKIMLWVILNWLMAKDEELLAEEQAGFRPGCSTEQNFNSWVIIEKHLQHQHDLLHNFIDFKKAFDRVRHAGLWQIFNIDESLVLAIWALYENSSSAVFLNSHLVEFFKTIIGVCQRCLFSPILLNLFLEMMQETLLDHHGAISFGGKPKCNQWFADDIGLTGTCSGELQNLTS